MKKQMTCAVMALGFAALAQAGSDAGADEGADLAKAATCIECHESVAMSLKNQGEEAIAAKIKGFAGGQSSHEPVMEGASDADIAEVARLLNERD